MIAYASRTGNVRYICSQINLQNVEIIGGSKVDQPFILATYTDGFGEIPKLVQQFMSENASNCIGVIVSGNRNFGTSFGKAGELLAEQYGIPLICKLDLRGQSQNYAQISRFIEEKGLKDEAIFKIK